MRAVQFDGVEPDVASIAGGCRVDPATSASSSVRSARPLAPRAVTPDGLTGATPSVSLRSAP